MKKYVVFFIEIHSLAMMVTAALAVVMAVAVLFFDAPTEVFWVCAVSWVLTTALTMPLQWHDAVWEYRQAKNEEWAQTVTIIEKDGNIRECHVYSKEHLDHVLNNSRGIVVYSRNK